MNPDSGSSAAGRSAARSAQGERVAHHRPLREAAENERFLEAVEQLGERLKLGQNVSGSGVGMPPSRYQCRPPGGSASGPRGVSPRRRRCGSSASSSG